MRKLYTERMLYFPDTFYLADHTRSFHTRALADPAALPAYSKSQVGNGMRAGAFVFASFNQPFKISPRVWEVWMRLLRAVEGSQLWVTKLNEGAAAEGDALGAESVWVSVCG